jgi:hypothetical protein
MNPYFTTTHKGRKRQTGVAMRQTNIICWTSALLALAMATPTMAADTGTQVGTYTLEESWSRLQGRLMLGVAPPTEALDAAPTRLTSVSLLGDYYLGRPFGPSRVGGLRATSGLLAGPRAAMWGGLSSGNPVQIERRASMPYTLADGDSGSTTVPYLGIGYTGLSLRDGWGMSVDVGLIALRPRSASQLGNVLNGTQGLDNMLRDMRLSPILQLGVSYAF